METKTPSETHPKPPSHLLHLSAQFHETKDAGSSEWRQTTASSFVIVVGRVYKVWPHGSVSAVDTFEILGLLLAAASALAPRGRVILCS